MCNQMICAATWLTSAVWLSFYSELSICPQCSSNGYAALLVPCGHSSNVYTSVIILSFPQGSTLEIGLANFPGSFLEKMQKGILRVKHYYRGNVSFSYRKRCDLQNECPSDKCQCEEISTCSAVSFGVSHTSRIQFSAQTSESLWHALLRSDEVLSKRPL